MKKQEELFFIRIRCKRYVQRYLVLKFGCPVKGHPYLVDIRKDMQLKSFLYKAIKNPCKRYDNRYNSLEGKKRDCDIELKISSDFFSRYGYELAITDEVSFNSMIEARAKKELLDFLKVQYILHEDINDAINEFYSNFGYSERTWPSSSIAKIWTRQKAKLDIICLKNEINEIFNKIFMVKLSQQKDSFTPSLESCLN